MLLTKMIATLMGAAGLTLAVGAPALVVAGCADDGGGLALTATALVMQPSDSRASVRIIGATDWEAEARTPLTLTVLLDGEPAGFELGEPALTTAESAAVVFSVPEGSRSLALALGDEVVWDFGVTRVEAGRVTDLLFFGSPSAPGTRALPELGDDLPSGRAAGRLINLDDRGGPVDALLCPEAGDDLDACVVVAEGLAYGEAWTGVVDVAARQVLLWERPAPADYPGGRMVGGSSVALGSSLCPAGEALTRTTTVIPLSVEAADGACPYCTSGWILGDGTMPGDCGW